MRLSSSVGREAGTRNPSSYVELRRVEFTDLCLAPSSGKNFGQKKAWAPEGTLALIYNSHVVHHFYLNGMT